MVVTVQKKTKSVIPKKCRERIYLHNSFILIRKKTRIKLQSLQIFINAKIIKSAPRISVIIFDGMVCCRGEYEPKWWSVRAAR